MTDEQLLKVLSDNENSFVSGETLSISYGLSRTAVWKHIKSLKDRGYTIESVTNKGYRLTESDVLDTAEIKSYLNTVLLGSDIQKYHTVGSTNTEAKRNSDMPDGTLFISDIQTHGRGRRGKEWDSSTTGGLYMSLLLKPDISPCLLPSLTLVLAVAIIRAVKNIIGKQTFIKWPNDIISDGRKLCGILCEMSAEADRTEYAICGIGININQNSFPDNLKSTATSLFIRTGIKTSRNRFAAEILNCFEPVYFDFLKYGIKNIIEEYKSACITLNSDVIITDKNVTYNAKAVDIGKNGELIVFTGGNTKAVFSGEVSVRGIMGYV